MRIALSDAVSCAKHFACDCETDRAAGSRLRTWGLWVSVAAVALLPYLNALPNDFVWDDRPLILQDPQIRSFRHWRDIFIRDFFAFSENQLKYGYYRPLITISYMTDFHLWGKRPWGFRLTNILFHIGSSLLVMFLARRLRIGSEWLPWVAGWLFAVHPVHVESVTWIAGRTDVLATFFLLLAFLLYMRARTSPSRAYMTASLVLWGVAALCKETALVFPLFIALYELCMKKSRLFEALRRSGPHAIAVVLYVLWRTAVTRAGWNPFGIWSPLHFVAAALKTLGRYLGLLLFPYSLSAYIQNPPPASPFDPFFWFGIAAVGAGAWFCWRHRKDQPAMAWLVAALGASFLPIMNIIRISAPADMGFPMAERFLYLPSVFFCIGAAVIIERIPSPSVRQLFPVVVLGLFGLRTALRNTVWRDEETFFRACLASAPDAPLLHAALASHYLNMGRADDAVAAFQRANKLNLEQTCLESDFILNNLAAAYRLAGRPQEALAILERIGPEFSFPAVHYNRGAVWAALGETAKAEHAYQTALRLDPYHVESLVGLARLLQSRGNNREAAAYFQRATALFPDESSLWNALGVALKQSNQPQEALHAFHQALRLDPTSFEARGNLGVTLAMLGNTAEAERELRRAIELNPGHWDAWNALGTLLAIQDRRVEAEKCFDTILQSAPTQPDALVNKGILRFQEGKRDEARRFFEAAVRADPKNVRAVSYLRQLETQ